MPDLRNEAHLRRLKRVFTCDSDVDFIVAAFVRSVRGTGEVAFEVGEVDYLDAVLWRCDGDAGVSVFEDVLNFLLQAAVAVGHGLSDVQVVEGVRVEIGLRFCFGGDEDVDQFEETGDEYVYVCVWKLDVGEVRQVL